MVGFAEPKRKREHNILADPFHDRIGQSVGVAEIDRSVSGSHLFYPVPARIGLEALTIFRSQLCQSKHDVGYSARACIVHRATAKWSKTGCEYHCAVNRILVGDYALAQTGYANVEHLQNEAIGHIGAWRRCAGGPSPLFRLSSRTCLCRSCGRVRPF